MKKDEMDLKYCFNYVGNMNNEGYMISGPVKRINLEKGSLIAWLDFKNEKAYIVEYLRPRSFFTLGELSLSKSDWTYLHYLDLGHITTLEQGCNVNNLLEVLSGRFSYQKFTKISNNQPAIDRYYSVA